LALRNSAIFVGDLQNTGVRAAHHKTPLFTLNNQDYQVFGSTDFL
jgi:hypothetical protein